MVYIEVPSKIPSFERYVMDEHAYSLEGFLCPECLGDGKLYDPEDPPDSYEGNKLRRVIKCQRCKGEGIGDFESDWKKHHKEYVAVLKKQNAEIRYENKVKRNALKKLTKEEKGLLGL